MPYYSNLEGNYPKILERLRTTSARLDEVVDSLTPDQRLKKSGGKWSIQENVGHLLCIESLWIARLDDFVAGNKTLRPWNGTNTDTDAARFNEQNLRSILRDFKELREIHVAMLESYEATCEQMISFHERLNTQVRLLDHVYMMAEHDDAHLKTMQQLKMGMQY